MNGAPTPQAGLGGGCCYRSRRRCRCCRCCCNAGSRSAPSAAAVTTAAAAGSLLLFLCGVCCGPLLLPAAAAEDHSFEDAAVAAASLSLRTDLPHTVAAAKSLAAAAVTAATGGLTHTTGGATDSKDGKGEGRAGRTLLGIPAQAAGAPLPAVSDAAAAGAPAAASTNAPNTSAEATTAAPAMATAVEAGAEAVAGSGGPKYLLALCVSGRLSNHELCMGTHMAFASILNRTLIVPEWAVAGDPSVPGNAWRWDIAVDWARVNRCLARPEPAAVLLQDYLRSRALPSLNLSRLLCLKWRDDRTGCVHQNTWRLLHQLNGSLHLPMATPAGERNVTGAAAFITDEAEVLRLYGRLEDEVLCVGEGFAFFILPPYELPVVEDEPGCANVRRPVPAIMDFVKGLVDTMLGDEYASVHVRRGDMYAQAQAMKRMRGPSAGGYLSAADVAKQIKERFADANVSMIFIASDGRKAELELLFALLGQPPGKTFAAIVTLRTILHRDEGLEKEGWAQGFFQLVRDGHGEIALTMADKYLCARARHFLGSKDSTFSMSIDAIRRLEGRRSPLDGTISP